MLLNLCQGKNNQAEKLLRQVYAGQIGWKNAAFMKENANETR